MPGPPLRFDAAEKRLVRACACEAGGGSSDPCGCEQSGRQRAARSTGGESLPPPLKRSRAVFSSFVDHGANSRSAAATPPSRRQRRRRLTGQSEGRRPVRGVTDEAGKSGWRRRERCRPRFATAVRISWLQTRFLAVVRTIPGDSVIVSTPAGSPIFHADEPGVRPQMSGEPTIRASAYPDRSRRGTSRADPQQRRCSCRRRGYACCP